MMSHLKCSANVFSNICFTTTAVDLTVLCILVTREAVVVLVDSALIFHSSAWSVIRSPIFSCYK